MQEPQAQQQAQPQHGGDATLHMARLAPKPLPAAAAAAPPPLRPQLLHGPGSKRPAGAEAGGDVKRTKEEEKESGPQYW